MFSFAFPTVVAKGIFLQKTITFLNQNCPSPYLPGMNVAWNSIMIGPPFWTLVSGNVSPRQLRLVTHWLKLQFIVSRNTDYLRAAQLDNLVVVTGNVGHGGELDWNTTSSFVAVIFLRGDVDIHNIRCSDMTQSRTPGRRLEEWKVCVLHMESSQPTCLR